MSTKPKPGGRVQISGKKYTVLEGPKRSGKWFRIMVRSNETQGGYWARSEEWRAGCGPWKIEGPMIGD